MSFLFTLEEDNLSEQLPPIFEKYETKIQNAAPLFDLEGKRLELIARTIPYHQVEYEEAAHDMKQIMKWLENIKAKVESKLLKNMMSGQRVLGQREMNTFIAGEREIIELNQLLIESNLLYSKLDSIVEGFKQMGWMVQAVVKLRVAELHEVIL